MIAEEHCDINEIFARFICRSEIRCDEWTFITELIKIVLLIDHLNTHSIQIYHFTMEFHVGGSVL